MKQISIYRKRTLNLLRDHISNQNPISGKDIAKAINLPDRRSGKEGADMRNLIHSLRILGYPICAGGLGYYYAKNKDELAEYIESLANRIKAQKEAKKGLESSFTKVGQMEIIKEDKDAEIKEMAEKGIFG